MRRHDRSASAGYSPDVIVREHSITRLNLMQVDVEGFDMELIGTIDFEITRPARY